MFADAADSATVEIRLKRVDRIFRPNEVVEGTLVVQAKEPWDYRSIVLKVRGNVRMADGPANRGLFAEAQKPLELLHETIDLAGPGRFITGRTEMLFEFPVRGIADGALHESYHGVYLNVGYIILVHIERGFMRAEVSQSTEFVVEVPTPTPPPAKELPFVITPEALKNVRSSTVKKLPQFRISGRLHRTSFPINTPLTGEVVVEASKTPLRSLEVQLVRVENVDSGAQGREQDRLREATEIQNLQIGDGDVCRGMTIPIYMIFPRLFSCPTMVTPRFKVEFELNLIVVFTDGYMVTENFPVVLYRE